MIKKSSTVAIIWVIISLFSAVLIAYFGRMIMGAELLADGSQKLVFIAMSRQVLPSRYLWSAAGGHHRGLHLYRRLPAVSSVQLLYR